MVKIQQAIVADVCIVKVTAPSLDEVDSAVSLLLKKRIAEGSRLFVLDLSGTMSVGSTGVGTIFGVLARLRMRMGKIVLAGPKERLLEYLRIIRLAHEIEVFDNAEAALSSLLGMPPDRLPPLEFGTVEQPPPGADYSRIKKTSISKEGPSSISFRGKIRFGVFEVDLLAGELRKRGVKIKLQEQPFQVLAMLLERPGEVVTREEIQKQLWPDTIVEFESNLNAAIKRLRDALDDSADNPRFVETLHRRGYRFIAPVEPI